MIHITPSRVTKYLLLGLILPGIALFFHFTRFNYIPVTAVLGSCQMDYTSPLSYQERVSPLVGQKFDINGWDMLICYGQPAMKDRVVMGDLVQYDILWRFGANEPTRFYTTADVALGGLAIPKGRYSLYAIPGKYEWEIFVSTSIDHWGNNISESVRSKEMGSFKIKSEYIRPEVEKLSFVMKKTETGDPDDPIEVDNLIYEWENTRLTIPVELLETEDKTDKSLQGQIKEKSKELKELEENSGTTSDDLNDLINQ